MKNEKLQISRRDLLRKGAAFAAVSALSLSALAADPAKAGDPDGWQAFQGALNFAAEQGGVGIVIFPGADITPYTPAGVGRGLSQGFRDRGSEAQSFFYTVPGKQVTTISYILSSADVMGPYNINEALQNLETAVEKHRIMKLHASAALEPQRN